MYQFLAYLIHSACSGGGSARGDGVVAKVWAMVAMMKVVIMTLLS